MTQFIALTRKGGQTVHVNIERVEFIEAEKDGAKLVFLRMPYLEGEGALIVRESPEDIISRANAR